MEHGLIDTQSLRQMTRWNEWVVACCTCPKRRNMAPCILPMKTVAFAGMLYQQKNKEEEL